MYTTMHTYCVHHMYEHCTSMHDSQFYRLLVYGFVSSVLSLRLNSQFCTKADRTDIPGIRRGTNPGL